VPDYFFGQCYWISSRIEVKKSISFYNNRFAFISITLLFTRAARVAVWTMVACAVPASFRSSRHDEPLHPRTRAFVQAAPTRCAQDLWPPVLNWFDLQGMGVAARGRGAKGRGKAGGGVMSPAPVMPFRAYAPLSLR